jgi:hypothetical protein
MLVVDRLRVVRDEGWAGDRSAAGKNDVKETKCNHPYDSATIDP